MSGANGPERVRGTDQAYPLPETRDDARFTTGLVIDVAQVLEQHGYPKLVDGLDLVDLQQALFRFLYRGRGPLEAR